MGVFLQLHMGKQAEEQQKFGERVSRAVLVHLVRSRLWIPALGGLSPGRDCHAGDAGYPQPWGHERVTNDVLPPASVCGCS